MSPASTPARMTNCLERTYADIGADARTNHQCLGTGGVPAIPGVQFGGRGGGPGGGGVATYQLMDTSIAGEMDKDAGSLIALRRRRYRLARRPREIRRREPAGRASYRRPRQVIVDAGGPRAEGVRRRRRRRHRRADRSRALTRWFVRCAVQLGAIGLDDATRSMRSTIRQSRKERNYEDAVIAAHGLTFEALADDGLIIAGQPIKASFVTINRGATDVAVTAVDVAGFAATKRARLRTEARRPAKQNAASHGCNARAAECRRTSSRPSRTSTTATGSIRRTWRATTSIRTCRSALRSRRRRSA